MSTAETLVDIYRTLLSLDSKTLTKVRSYINSLKSESTDGWDGLTTTQQKEIENAIHSLENGEGIPHKKVMAKYKGKYL
jgi:hypothetical protein